MKQNLIRMFCLALCVGFLSVPSVSQAQIFKWQDEQGHDVFTNTLSTIPPEVLKKNQVVTIREVASLEEIAKRNRSRNSNFFKGGDKATKQEDSEVAPPVATAKAEDVLPEETLSLLKETYALLKKDADVREKILKFVEPKEINQKYYVRPLRKFALKKKKLAPKLASTQHPDLSAANVYLVETAQEDEELEMREGEPEAVIQMLQTVQARLAKEVPTVKKLVTQLEKTLEKYKKPEEESS